MVAHNMRQCLKKLSRTLHGLEKKSDLVPWCPTVDEALATIGIVDSEYGLWRLLDHKKGGFVDTRSILGMPDMGWKS